MNCIAIYYTLQKQKKSESGETDGNGKYNEKEILDRVNEASDGIALTIIPTIHNLGDISRKIRKPKS